MLSLYRLATLASTLTVFLGCSSAGTGSSNAAIAGNGGTAGAATSSGGSAAGGVSGSGGTGAPCSGLPPSQTLSEPCCADYGPDACGAGLFCAAFDGRTQLTCYADGSRMDMTECNADTQCQSGACSATESKCQSKPGAACSDAIGCAAVGNSRYVCVAGNCQFSAGKLGDACNGDVACQQGQCIGGVCVGVEGTACSDTSECRSDLCCNGTCQVCGQGIGEPCTPPPFPILVCKPGLSCCPLDSGSGGVQFYCYQSC